jgi:nickel superoxide dismutase
MKLPRILLAFFAAVPFSSGTLSAHCQIPCGIFADDIVFGELMTDVATIEKSMKQILSIGESDSKDWNQLVRWINNKETHANNIMDTMAHYFLSQRVKLGQKESDPEGYRQLVELAHEVMVLAMKCKQGTSLEEAAQLGERLHEFQHAYNGK